ncbi:MAG: hypothetical protein HYS17_04685 [Micavibrio aeruginosavorus]|uniref:Glycine zipper family protein n=1 Tax=Micavibrio aeruginosavorus TaxID=349221 RepID=A0A7T5R3Z6_9BACT|nr:MAG: hypothetical protein HYS17_04685 [Micavibrio aeruginosavorus]
MRKWLSLIYRASVVSIAFLGVSGFAALSHAGDNTGKTIKAADGALSCEQIAHEVVELDQIIRAARAKQENSEHAGTGISVAKTVGSLLVGSLGGVVGIVAVGALAGEAAEESGENAAETEEQAEERQNRLAGIYEGKGCEGELALTVDNPLEESNDVVAKLEPASGLAAKAIRVKPRYND